MSQDKECYPTRTVVEYVYDMIYPTLFCSAIVIVLGFCYKTKLEAWRRNIFLKYFYSKASEGDVSDPSEVPLQDVGNGSTGVPNNDLSADTATSSGAASG